MAVVINEELMAPGGWEVDVDWSPVVADELTVEVDGKRRPRKVHVLLYDPDDDLIYSGVLLDVVGNEEGMHLSGRGMRWHLGAGGIGPTIGDREYVSGANKLGNGPFELLDVDGSALYYVLSEQSQWTFVVGAALKVAATDTDDVLASDEKFPTRAGNAYRATAVDVAGVGTMRVRTMYEGRFDPPNLLPNPTFTGSSGWTPGTYTAIAGGALVISPIDKPQLIAPIDSGTGWTLPAEIDIVNDPTNAFGDEDWVIVCAPNPLVQLLDDLEDGDWDDTAADMGVVNNPAHALDGDYVMQVGPNIQRQVFLNADMGDGLDNWYSSSATGGVSTEPDPQFYADAGAGIDGGDAITTEGWATAGDPGGPDVKYLRADKEAGTAGVQAYDVTPGENYRAECYLVATPGSDGIAYVRIMIPHPSNPAHNLWWNSPFVIAPPADDNQWHVGTIENINVPGSRTQINGILEVHDHSLGYWKLGHFTLTRTRGNRGTIRSAIAYPVTPGTSYGLSGFVLAGDGLQVGDVRYGVVLSGTGLVDTEVEITVGNNDFEWTEGKTYYTPGEGVETATPYVSCVDVIGDSYYLDLLKMWQDTNNTAEATGPSFAVVPDQRYLLSVPVRSGPNVSRGSTKIGVRLTGAGLADEIVSVDVGITKDEWQNKSAEIRPGPGYTSGTLVVRSTDILSDSFYIGQPRLFKMDNNSDFAESDDIDVTPEWTYRFATDVASGLALQRGTVKLAARCIRAGHDDVTFESSAMETTADTVKRLTFEFTPPSGYDTVRARVVGTDVEGDTWTIDDGDLRDTDSSTVVFDAVATDPGGADVYVDSAAPAGAEFVSAALVAEEGSTSWSVHGLSLACTGVTPATGDAIVADLLTDPDTGDPLSVMAGDVNCPEVIPYDWRIVNLTDSEALDHYCSVVSDPPREYRVNPDRTVDVGEASVVFTDHSPASAAPVVYLQRDIDVEDLPEPEVNVEDRPTHVRVDGAVRKTRSGRDFLITATAEVPGTAETDWNGNPIVRTKPVSDGTVDHPGYAQALATDLAAREAEPPLSMTATLNPLDTDTAIALDVPTRPPYGVGDWIYVWYPEAGLEDAAYATTIEGEPVFPARVRVLSRTRSLGPRYRAEIRRTDGTTFELPGVLWSEKDETSLIIGDRLQEWEADPQGQAEGVQYLRDRVSAPR